MEVIRKLQILGGELILENDGHDLRVKAPCPLPQELWEALCENKLAIMATMAVPLDTAATVILTSIRDFLPPALRRLPDERLLILVNYSILAGWQETIRRMQMDQSSVIQSGGETDSDLRRG